MTGENMRTTVGVVRLGGDTFIGVSPPASIEEMITMSYAGGVVTQSEIDSLQEISQAEPPFSLFRVSPDVGHIEEGIEAQARDKAREVAICLSQLRGHDLDLITTTRDITDLNIYPFEPVQS